MFESVVDLNQHYVEHSTKLDIYEYIEILHKNIERYNSIDLAFMYTSIKFIKSEETYPVNAKEELFKYGAIKSENNTSKDILRTLIRSGLEENSDYRVGRVAQPVKQGGYSYKNIYMLTADAFKKILLDVDNHEIRKRNIDYYLFLEKAISHYNDYQIMYKDHILSGKDTKIDEQTKLLKEQSKLLEDQSRKIDDLLGHTKDIKKQNDGLKEDNKELKSEVKKVNQTLDKVRCDLHELKKELKKSYEVIGTDYKNKDNITKVNCPVLYKLTDNKTNEVCYYLSVSKIGSNGSTYRDLCKKYRNSDVTVINYLFFFIHFYLLLFKHKSIDKYIKLIICLH